MSMTIKERDGIHRVRNTVNGTSYSWRAEQPLGNYTEEGPVTELLNEAENKGHKYTCLTIQDDGELHSTSAQKLGHEYKQVNMSSIQPLPSVATLKSRPAHPCDINTNHFYREFTPEKERDKQIKDHRKQATKYFQRALSGEILNKYEEQPRTIYHNLDSLYGESGDFSDYSQRLANSQNGDYEDPHTYTVPKEHAAPILA